MVRLMIVAFVLGIVACGHYPAPGTAGGGACGNQCAAFNCPSGSRCVQDNHCTPRCEQEQLRR